MNSSKRGGKGMVASGQFFVPASSWHRSPKAARLLLRRFTVTKGQGKGRGDELGVAGKAVSMSDTLLSKAMSISSWASGTFLLSRI